MKTKLKLTQGMVPPRTERGEGLANMTVEDILDRARDIPLPPDESTRWTWLRMSVGLAAGSITIAGRLMEALILENGVQPELIRSRLKLGQYEFDLYRMIGAGTVPEEVITRACPMITEAVEQHVPKEELFKLCTVPMVNVVKLIRKPRGGWTTEIVPIVLELITCHQAKRTIRNGKWLTTKEDLKAIGDEMVKAKRDADLVLAGKPYEFVDDQIYVTIPRRFTWNEWSKMTAEFETYLAEELKRKKDGIQEAVQRRQITKS